MAILSVEIGYSATSGVTSDGDCDVVVPFQFGWGVSLSRDGTVNVTEYQDLGFRKYEGVLLQAEAERIDAIVSKANTVMVQLAPDARPCFEEINCPDIGGPGQDKWRWDYKATHVPQSVLQLRDELRDVMGRVILSGVVSHSP